MIHSFLEIQITPGNVRRGHFYIPRDSDLVPQDAWGGRNASVAAIPIDIWFEGINESVSTDIDGTKRILRNARGQVARFYSHHGLSGGEVLQLLKVGVRSYRVSRGVEKPATLSEEVDEGTNPADRRVVELSRLVRDTTIALDIKRLYEYHCQVCRIAIKTKFGLYAEAAHIRPLGSPHDGPDVRSNVLCLCPNHHVMFDNGGFKINSDFSLVGIEGTLFVDASHKIGEEFLAYHRET